MILWIVFAVITAAVAVFIVRPFFSSRSSRDRSDYDLEVYRDQLTELDRDVALGVVEPKDADGARAEISRRLLAADACSTGNPAILHNASPRLGLALIAAVLPLASVSLYLLLGSPGLPSQPLSVRLEAPVEGQSIEALVAKVEARLRTHPADGAGWDVVAPVYLRLGQHERAADAFGNAIRLLGETPRRLLGYSEALAKANDGVFTTAARAALQRATELAPEKPELKLWLGFAAEQQGDLKAAQVIYEGLLAEAPADAVYRPDVVARLDVLTGRRAPGAIEAPVAGRGPDVDQIAAAEAMAPEDRTAMIRGMVDGLAQRLAADGDDLAGWQRLVRSYRVLGEREKADDALEQARKAMAARPEALKALRDL